MAIKEEIQIHEKSIEELRREYDEIALAFSRASTRALTFLGGGFAFLSYLYGYGTTNGLPNALFIPREIYGVIFYFFGLFSYIGALFFSFLAIRPVVWRTPAEREVNKDLSSFKTYLDYLQYCKNRYIDAIDHNLPLNERKQKRLNLSSLLLVVGVLVLIVLKNFQ